MTAYHSCQAGKVQVSAAAIMQLNSHIRGMFPKYSQLSELVLSLGCGFLRLEGTGSLSIIHRAKWNGAASPVTACLH